MTLMAANTPCSSAAFRQTRWAWLSGLCVLLAALVCSVPAAAAEVSAYYRQIKAYFPEADSIGAPQGTPTASPVYRDKTVIGYAFLTDEVVPIPAYSGKPIKTLVASDLSGRIRGVEIISHEEPILEAGVSEQQLADFVAQYAGIRVTDRIKVGGDAREGFVTVDAISGATITMMVLNASITRSLEEIAKSRGLLGEASQHARDTPLTPAQPIWRLVWQERLFQIGVLMAALSLLGLILLFQDWLARHPTLLLYVRDGYLIFTVLFIGWYTLAQLSVVNVFVFVRAMMHDFQWDTFLIDPMLFILWGFVAVTLLLWGRGVYCGWLCPFGALQELLNTLARKLRIRQWELPEVVHERLWALKYVLLLMLFALSLQSMTVTERYLEIEPFKTAITLRFQREWGYVLYAGALLLISVVNRKFYCKYLCALGAALAIPARLRLFDWLRRRKECGRPCQICAQECEVRAIKPTGEIIANECHYCLDCQVTYWNAYRCPPVVERRKRYERIEGRAKASASAMQEVSMESLTATRDASADGPPLGP
jgi:NosR/NirI family nitrous oxide reductase transcriptional regulator